MKPNPRFPTIKSFKKSSQSTSNLPQATTTLDSFRITLNSQEERSSPKKIEDSTRNSRRVSNPRSLIFPNRPRGLQWKKSNLNLRSDTQLLGNSENVLDLQTERYGLPSWRVFEEIQMKKINIGTASPKRSSYMPPSPLFKTSRKSNKSVQIVLGEKALVK
jgi:hypothetical protein